MVLFALLVTVMLVTPASALPASSWKAGQEKDITGHAFTEEYWTKEAITNTTNDGLIASFSLSYVNYKDVQAFLISLNSLTKNSTVGTLPYQMFGMHYYTKAGTENFLVAVLAFLLAYNDTNSNGMPDLGNENCYYVVPFGVGDSLKNVSENFMPESKVISAEKLGEGHYKFGMQYKNLYAKIFDANNIIAFWLSAALPLYIARFSEFTVTYDITIDQTTGTAKAESFYTLGQVDRLWIFGQNVGREALPDNFGISAVHYVATFASTYTVAGSTTGAQITSGVNKPLDENLTLKIGKDERAMELGYRGTFDLKNETSGQYVEQNKKAYNALVAARPFDGVLVAWQAGFSLDVLCTMAYGLSKDIRNKYTSPLDLYNRGKEHFWGAAFWYGVCFPNWKGYRVEHDPTITAFIGPAQIEHPPAGCKSVIYVGAIGLLAIPAIIIQSRRSKKDS